MKLYAVIFVFLFCLCMAARADTETVWSTDVPMFIPDNDLSGSESGVYGPNLVIEDVQLHISNLVHQCVSDLHIELVSPAGTTSVLIRAWNEGGIFQGMGCMDDLLGTVFDDDSATNLRDGTAPFTGTFNIEHSSVSASPLNMFTGESAQGEWRLRIADHNELDTGELISWGLTIEGRPLPKVAPVQMTAAGPQLQFLELVPGNTYEVQTRTNLISGSSWLQSTVFTAAAESHYWQDSQSPSNPPGFYRLIEQ